MQQYYLKDDVLCWRDAEMLPPCSIRIQSPYDADARYSSKRTIQWVGYKVHLTETCDDDTPHLITHVETTPATLQDVEVVEAIHADLKDLGCLPAQHVADAGYSSSGLFFNSQADYGVDLIAPVRPEHSWQHTAKAGFEASKFQIDWDRQKVICPMGKESTSWTPCPQRRGHTIFYVKFREPDCRTCPVKTACTKGKRRAISVQERELVEMIEAKRAFQQTEAYQDLYRRRAGVEGTLSHATWVLGMRRARYIGQDKTHLQNSLTAAAINLTRAVNWLNETPLAETRVSRFKALAA